MHLTVAQEEKVEAEKAFKDVGEAYSVLSDPQVSSSTFPAQLAHGPSTDWQRLSDPNPPVL